MKSTQFSMEQIAGSVKQAGSNEFRKVIIGCNTLHKSPNKNLFIYSRGSLLRVSLLHHGMSLQAISKHSVHRSKNCFKSFVYFLQCFDHPSVFTRSLNMTHPQALSMEKRLKINCQISDFFLGGGCLLPSPWHHLPRIIWPHVHTKRCATSWQHYFRHHGLGTPLELVI